MTTDTTYRESDWEHGLACPDCGHAFQEGEQYAERLDAYQDDTPIVVITCRPCALGKAT